eukprot:UN22275
MIHFYNLKLHDYQFSEIKSININKLNEVDLRNY